MALDAQTGFALTIAAALQGGDAGAWVPVAGVTLGACVVAAASAATARETYQLELHELGRHEASSTASALSTAS